MYLKFCLGSMYIDWALTLAKLLDIHTYSSDTIRRKLKLYSP